MQKSLVRLTLSLSLFLACAAFLLARKPFYRPCTLSWTTQTAVDSVVSWDSGTGFKPHQSVTAGSRLFLHSSLPQSARAACKRRKNLLHHIDSFIKDPDSLTITGWAFPRDTRQPAAVYVMLVSRTDTHVFAAEPLRRPDVAAAFAKDALAGSGFQVNIPRQRLTPGWYRLAVAVDAPGGGFVPSRRTVIQRGQAGSDPVQVIYAQPLPQLPIRRLRIATGKRDVPVTNVHLRLGDRSYDLPVTQCGDSYYVSLEPVDRARYFPFLLVLSKLLLAGICAFLFWALLVFFSRRPADCTVWSWLFHMHQRWLFWLLFTLMALVSLTWLLGQWPGIMSFDSLETWYFSKTLKPDNWHPYINVLYFLAIQQIYDHPAAVGLLQILTTSLLFAWIFYRLHRLEVHRWFLIPCYMACLFAVPVGVYSITLWKDIPFALLALFWAFTLWQLGMQKKISVYAPSTPKLLFWSVALVALCMFRHNGVIYLALVPAFLFVCRLIPRRKLALLLLCSLLLALCGYLVIPRAEGIHSRTQYQMMNLSWKLVPVGALFTGEWYYSDNYAQDYNMVSQLIHVEDLKEHYSPRMWDSLKPYLKPEVLTDGYVRRFNAFYVRRMLENLPIFLGNRVFGLITVLCSRQNMLYQNFLVDLFYREHPGFGPNILHCYNLHFAPRSRLLYRAQTRLLRGVANSNWRLVVWNSLFALLLLVLVLFFHHNLPVCARYALFYLIPMACLFITLPAREFRYGYFLYLSAFPLLPMVVAELQGAKKQQSPNQST